jgi:drug/metabolite transporter (DMT)-like permease
MSAEQIRSIGCGPIGALFSAVIASIVFNWQAKRWAHRIPSNFGKKEKNQLVKEYKNTNRIAKVFGLAGLSTLFIYYSGHSTTGSDWRGLGMAFGLMAFLPVAYVVAANIVQGHERVKEALVAFIINERTPPRVLFTFIGICFIIGVICAISVLLQPP